MSALPASDRAAPLHLWRIASTFLDTLFSLFGAPEHLAEEHTLSAKTHALIVSWLRVGETLLRHLLFLEAAACVAPASRRHAGTTPAARHRRIMEFTADKPENWRVSFCCFSSFPAGSGGSAKRGEAKGQQTRRKDLLSAWPLAERYEALIRVFNNPTPYAKRLARRLHAQPALIEDVLTTTEDFRAPHGWLRAHITLQRSQTCVRKYKLVRLRDLQFVAGDART